MASTLIVPVENQVRELDAKLLLSCCAAERGFPVVLGSRTFVHFKLASIPRGVYLAKSMRSLSNRMFDILRKLGHEIVAWDEEALVRAPDPQYYAHRLSPETIQKVSALFAWGPDDARVFRDYPGYGGTPIHITGNPRIDMMRGEVRSYYDEEAEKIRSRFGRFVLLNTNFGWSNHFIPNFVKINVNKKQAGEQMERQIAHRSVVFDHFKAMLPRLSEAFPDLTILVRPHPVENHATWQGVASKNGNVVVTNEGTVIPWLMACEVLLHNSCTTAVEAALLDKPAIDYQPVRLEQLDNQLPNALSHRTSDFDQLQEMIRAIVNREMGIREFSGRRSLIDHHIAALEGPLASERMLDVLEEAGYADEPLPRSNPARYLEGWLHVNLRTAVKKANMRRSGHRNSIEYHAHRFPHVSLDTLRGKVERLRRQLGRFDGVRVRELSEHIFHVEPRGG